MPKSPQRFSIVVTATWMIEIQLSSHCWSETVAAGYSGFVREISKSLGAEATGFEPTLSTPGYC
jgi:hypothetical protein